MKVLIFGGNKASDTLGVIVRGFQRAGLEVEHIPTRKQAQKNPGNADDNKPWIEVARKKLDHNEYEFAFYWNPKYRDYKQGVFEDFRKKYGLRSVYYTIDDPYVLDNDLVIQNIFPEFDAVVTCCEDSRQRYEKEFKIPALLLHPPCDEAVHYGATYYADMNVDFLFAGTNCYTKQRYPDILAERREIIRLAAKHGTLALYGYDDARDSGWTHPSGGAPELARHYKGFLSYEKLSDRYKSAKISLNSHVRPDGYKYLNQRVFEILGSGGFMLCDHVNGIEEIFKIGEHFDTWKTKNELAEKMKFWIDPANAAKRKEIVKAGQDFVLKHYSSSKFSQKVIEFMKGVG